MKKVITSINLKWKAVRLNLRTGERRDKHPIRRNGGYNLVGVGSIRCDIYKKYVCTCQNEREREREQGTGRVKFALSFPLRFLKRHPPLGMLCNFTVQYEFEFQPSESCGQCYKCARTIITYKAVILNGPFPVSFLFFFK